MTSVTAEGDANHGKRKPAGLGCERKTGTACRAPTCSATFACGCGAFVEIVAMRRKGGQLSGTGDFPFWKVLMEASSLRYGEVSARLVERFPTSFEAAKALKRRRM